MRGATKLLNGTNSTLAESTETNGLSAFNSDGFSLGNEANHNVNGGSFVAWAWNAGDTTETIAAGDLTSSVYDQSQVWSNNAVTTGNNGNWTDVSNLFNGNLSNYAHANINASPVVVTLTFDPPLPATSGVKVYGGMTNSNVIWRVNDEANAPFNSANYNSVENFYSFTGDVSSITIGNSDGTNNASGLYLYGVEVAGQLLIDAVEDSQVWSSGTYTGTAANNNYGVTDLFANVGKSGDAFGANKLWGLYQATGTFTLDNPIPLTPTSTLELITYQSGSSSGNITFTGSGGSLVPTLTVNGTNVLGLSLIHI